MRVGLIKNNASIAHEAIGEFLQEIHSNLSGLGHDVFVIKNSDDYLLLCQNKLVDLTIGIGKYDFHSHNRPLYDAYKIPHFNWIIDNPIKMNLDLASDYVYYIFIDLQFFAVLGKYDIQRCLFLPIGVSVNEKNYAEKKIDVLFAGQIKDVKKLYGEIKNLPKPLRQSIQIIIEIIFFDPSQSFIDVFNIMVNHESSAYLDEEKKIIFKYANSYTRAYKRKLVINNIKNTNICIIGDVEDSQIQSQGNVKIYSPLPYRMLGKLYSHTKFALNISPNYSYSCHDRILHSVSNGACCVSDSNYILRLFFRDLVSIVFYDLNDLSTLDEKLNFLLASGDYKIIHKNGYNVVKSNFSWQKIVKILIAFIRTKRPPAKAGGFAPGAED